MEYREIGSGDSKNKVFRKEVCVHRGGVSLSLRVSSETHPHTPTIYHFLPHTNMIDRLCSVLFND